MENINQIHLNFSKKKKKTQIIKWYICRDRKIENIIRNSSIFKENKLSSIIFRE